MQWIMCRCAERHRSEQAGLKGCGEDGGQDGLNSEESRAREERVSFVPTELRNALQELTEAWILGVKPGEGDFLSAVAETLASVVFASPGSFLVCGSEGWVLAHIYFQ